MACAGEGRRGHPRGHWPALQAVLGFVGAGGRRYGDCFGEGGGPSPCGREYPSRHRQDHFWGGEVETAALPGPPALQGLGQETPESRWEAQHSHCHPHLEPLAENQLVDCLSTIWGAQKSPNPVSEVLLLSPAPPFLSCGTVGRTPDLTPVSHMLEP